MNGHGLAISGRRAADLIARRRSRLERHRLRLDDGRATSMYVAAYELEAFSARVVALKRPLALAQWCREQAVKDALVGGFFVRASATPLGELWLAGSRQPSEPFAAPWDRLRGCVELDGPTVRIAARGRLAPCPTGDLLQAGPLLLDGGEVALDGPDPEGFCTAAHQFDSDITAGRYPRAALALAGERLLAVACDGRARSEAGLTLLELALALKRLGASEAINLDGGGSASLVYGGRLRNRPREEHGLRLIQGRPIVTAIAIEPRRA